MGRPPAIKLGFTKLNSILSWPVVAMLGFQAAMVPVSEPAYLNSFLIESFAPSHDLETLEGCRGIEAARPT
jgi:hypothetical protein